MSPPENPVELPGVAPPEIEVDDDVVPPLFPSNYGINYESDYKDKDTETSTQQRQRVIHLEAIPPTVRNVYNLRPRKKTDYAKENIDRLMLFAPVGSYLNKDVLYLFQHKETEHYEEKIDYVTVIVYAFTKY